LSNSQAKAAALPAGAHVATGKSKVRQAGDKAVDPRIVPVGPGGLAGKIFRCVVHVCTGGFGYPNVFIEGMDLMEKHKHDTNTAER
jgi:hypothetical protein